MTREIAAEQATPAVADHASSALGAGVADGRAGALYRYLPGVRGLEPLTYRG